MKIIFLDIDGVLNWSGFLLTADRIRVVDPVCVRRLNVLHAKTGAQICISSTWRHYSDTHEILANAGLKVPIVGKTPDLMDAPRGDEIREWMDSFSYKIDSFVIFDDDTDFDEDLTNNLVRTSMKDGLQDRHIDRAIEILNS